MLFPTNISKYRPLKVLPGKGYSYEIHRSIFPFAYSPFSPCGLPLLVIPLECPGMDMGRQRVDKLARVCELRRFQQRMDSRLRWNDPLHNKRRSKLVTPGKRNKRLAHINLFYRQRLWMDSGLRWHHPPHNKWRAGLDSTARRDDGSPHVDHIRR